MKKEDKPICVTRGRPWDLQLTEHSNVQPHVPCHSLDLVPVFFFLT